MTEHRNPVRRIGLPSSEHDMTDKKYRIKELVDRERPGRTKATKLALDFRIYRRLIDNVRTTIEDKSGAELSADPEMIIRMMLLLMTNEEVLGQHVYEASNSTPNDSTVWTLIRETFAWRLLARYNRELLRAIDEENGDEGRDRNDD